MLSMSLQTEASQRRLSWLPAEVNDQFSLTTLSSHANLGMLFVTLQQNLWVNFGIFFDVKSKMSEIMRIDGEGG